MSLSGAENSDRLGVLDSNNITMVLTEKQRVDILRFSGVEGGDGGGAHFVATAGSFRDIGINLNTLLALLGTFFIIINGGWFSFLIGMLCARYRDLNPTIASLVTLSFFLTPIIWNPSLIPDRAFILLYNPFFHFVESIRAPLLGQPVQAETWLVLTLITILGWILVIPAVSKMGRKLVYWL